MIKFKTTEDIYIDPAPAKAAHEKIKSGAMSGWLNLPTPETDLAQIKSAAQKINETSDFLVCIGIGGSYLGHRAIIEALGNRTKTKILYAGNSLSTWSLQQVLAEIKGHDFSLNVISKSGTTLEPAVAFRILKQKLAEKYGETEAYQRIYATTDARAGALRAEAEQNDYETLVVPKNVGGRYSVLTPVGLLPLAVAGLDIDALIAGANETLKNPDAAYAYAILRTLCAERSYDTEILATFEPEMLYFAEWWKQLFGESEGKNHQGIFPASVIYTTDLHSLGQFLQEGRRNIFETFLNFRKSYVELNNTRPDDAKIPSLRVPSTANDFDGLDYLAGRSLGFLNAKAYAATVEAHRAGGIPVFEVEIDDLSAKSLGELIAFFELSCAISATMQNVNPFDQPGVEAYKKNLFHLLEKPGII